MHPPSPAARTRRKPGRQPIPGLTQITLILDADDIGSIDAYAGELRRSRSDLVREAIREWLSRARTSSSRP